MSRVHDVCKPRVECVEPAAAAERERGVWVVEAWEFAGVEARGLVS